METLLQDLRYAWRNLVKSPVVVAVAVATMALGIGVNTAIFSVVNAVLLRPLPYQNADRLVRVWGTNLKNGRTRAWASFPNLQDWRAQNTSFERLAAYNDDRQTVTGAGAPEQVSVALVTQDFFAVLGVEPAVGRLFLPQEFQPGHDAPVMLSYGHWQRRFGGQDNILGQTLSLGGTPRVIVGVLPPNDLQFPSRDTDVWAPGGLVDNSRGSRNLNAIGLLKRGVSVQQAQAEMNTIAGRLEKQYPEENAGIGARLEPLRESIVADSRPLLLILFSVVGFILLIACVNVANLLLARVNTRRQEMAIRTALGASRFRVIRQLLTESVLLSVMGGAGGLLLAWWTTHLLVALNALEIPRQGEIAVDGWVLAFTLVMSIVPGLVIGLAPALEASRLDLAQACKEGARGAVGDLTRQWARRAMVVSEIALSVVLVTGAGLLIASFWRLQHVNPGFRSDNVLSFRISLPRSRYPDDPRRGSFYRQVIERLNVLPGVRGADAVSILPLSGGNLCNEATVGGQAVDSLQCVESRSISAGYFSTLGIPLLKGRVFNERDNTSAPRVAIINRTMARLLGSVDSAVGKQFAFRDEVRQVVGVVEDIKHSSLDTEIQPAAYLPVAQHPMTFSAFVVRTSTDPVALSHAVQAEIWSIDKDLPVASLKTMDEVLSASIAQPRLRMLLVGGFAALALFLAVLGLYSVVAYSVSQRTHEIGLRVALGAQPGDVVRLVVGQGLRLALIGIAVGLMGAVAATRVLAAMLFGIRATDPATFAAVALLTVAVALAASYLPAHKAMRIDPMVALRYE